MPPPTPSHLRRGPVAQGSSHSLTAMGSSSNHAPKLTEKRTFQCRAMSGREAGGGSEQGSLTSAKRAHNLHCVIIRAAAISWPCTLGSDTRHIQLQCPEMLREIRWSRGAPNHTGLYTAEVRPELDASGAGELLCQVLQKHGPKAFLSAWPGEFPSQNTSTKHKSSEGS